MADERSPWSRFFEFPYPYGTAQPQGVGLPAAVPNLGPTPSGMGGRGILETLFEMPFTSIRPEASGGAVPMPVPGERPRTQPPEQAVPPEEAPAQAQSNADLGEVIRGPQAAPPIAQPGMSDEMAIRKIMLQAGLNLLVPQWGDGISQIGQALGAGAEAVSNSQQVDQENRAAQSKLETERIKQDTMRALTEQREESAETSRSKRLTGGASGKKPSTEFERITNELQLGPKGKLYLKEELSKPEDILDPNAPTGVERVEQAIAIARTLDGQKTEAAPGTVAPAGTEMPIGTIIEDSAGVKWKKTFPGPATDKRNFTQVQ